MRPPAAGIEDKVDGPPGGWQPGAVDIVELGSRAGMLGLTTVRQATVRFHGPNGVVDAVVDKYAAPFYASHLGAVGTRLPAVQYARDPGKVRIDWPTAAMSDPGIGVPPLMGKAPGQGFDAGVFDRVQAKSVELTAGVLGFDTAPGAAEDDPVTWQTYVAASVAIKNAGWGTAETQDAIAQQHGIPAGEWDAVNRRWQGRMMTDWRLGAEYGQAMS